MNKYKVRRKEDSGFSLVEMMIVISIFAVIGILTTSVVSLTLKSSKKSDSLVRVRENVNYAMGVLERQIRNSENISSCTSTVLSYTSVEGIDTSFSCITPGVSGYIASGSARLTSSDIAITGCAITCTRTDANKPYTVDVSVTASDSTLTSVAGGSISTNIQIITRNY